MKATFFYRKSRESDWSIEMIFREVARQLSDKIFITEAVVPFLSNGIRNRIMCIWWTRKFVESEIYHITGDVHFLALGLPRRNSILTVHDLSYLKTGSWFSRFFLWFFWTYLPVRRVRFVTCVSEKTKSDILKYTRVKPSKVKVIPNFVLECFAPVHRPFNTQCPTLLQIGTAHNKNIDRLVDAIKGLNCHLRIIGKISESLHKLLTDNKISFSNKSGLTQEEILNEYIHADVVVFCSTLEGFGIPILEAQATGRVVVTSNISSMPEVAGDAAHLVDPFDVASMRFGVEKVISDEDYRNDLIEKGFHNIRRFGLKEVADLYLELYKEIGSGNTIT